MLQQILKDMYIEPELLEALNEDQKKTLFLKMRQEQVRRWKEREEKLEKEDAHRPKAKPKTGQGKSVSWLLGRDGDVQVLVIGETDELKSSKLICTGLGERNTPSQLSNSRVQAVTLKSNLINKASSDSVRSGRENLPPKTPAGIQLHLKDNSEEVKTPLPPQAVASEPKPSTDCAPSPSPSHDSQEDSESSRTAAARASPPPRYWPHLRPVAVATPSAHLGPASSLKVPDRSTASSSSSTASSSGGCSSSASSSSSSSSSSSVIGGGGVSRTLPGVPGSRTPSAQPQELQSSRGKEFRVVAASKRGLSLDEGGVSVGAAATSVSVGAAPSAEGGEVCVGRGRVAQLMKTFSVCGDGGATSQTATPTPARSAPPKPPVPTKPSHLRLQQSASLR